ncbi:MAG: hypothetical protein IKU52_02360 [Clostridia bacterium]|nr:hypothetical protein [Clostridia bacterium]
MAYLPVKKYEYETVDYSKTIFPEELENAVPEFAICKRNEWMINNSDYVISYVNKSYGGAANYKQMAQRKGLIVIEINDI